MKNSVRKPIENTVFFDDFEKEPRFVPILFSTEMVNAILNGSKTQTRRIVKPQPESHHWSVFDHYKMNTSILNTVKGIGVQFSHSINSNFERDVFALPKAYTGDIFWVRETWQLTDFLHPTDENYGYVYKASENGKEWKNNAEGWKWKPSIFMPKAACRIFLKVTDVRVERLHDISEDDAKMEGVQSAECSTTEGCIGCSGKDECQGKGTYFDYMNPSGECGWPCENAKDSFFTLWESINGQESLDSNPWVWVYSFKKIDRPKKFK